MVLPLPIAYIDKWFYSFPCRSKTAEGDLMHTGVALLLSHTLSGWNPCYSGNKGSSQAFHWPAAQVTWTIVESIPWSTDSVTLRGTAVSLVGRLCHLASKPSTRGHLPSACLSPPSILPLSPLLDSKPLLHALAMGTTTSTTFLVSSSTSHPIKERGVSESLDVLDETAVTPRVAFSSRTTGAPHALANQRQPRQSLATFQDGTAGSGGRESGKSVPGTPSQTRSKIARKYPEFHSFQAETAAESRQSGTVGNRMRQQTPSPSVPRNTTHRQGFTRVVGGELTGERLQTHHTVEEGTVNTDRRDRVQERNGTGRILSCEYAAQPCEACLEIRV